jgi:integrase
VVRAFSVYLHALDPAHEVPPVDLLPGPYTRITPYIYSEADIAALMAAAGSLPSSWRAQTYQTLIGLLAVTGIRLGEALGLNDDDLDHHRSVMTVRHTKREITREVPLHHSVLKVLVDYAAARDRVFPARDSNSLLVSTLGRRPGACTVEHTFARLVGAAGLVIPLGRRRPRAHDLRH